MPCAIPPAVLSLLLPLLGPLAQEPGVVDYDPTPPPHATWPVFTQAGPAVSGPGTVFDDPGTGRGQAWVDVVGPDPADPANPAAVGPPDGILDLVQVNSNTPPLPLGPPPYPYIASPGQWVTPPIGTVHNPSRVLRGDAQGEFTDVAGGMTPTEPYGFNLQYPGASPWGVVAADYDGDGYVDLFYPCGGFNVDSVNALMRNEGDGTFTNRTQEVGLTEKQASFAATWFDYDRDGDLDLYVANSAANFIVSAYIGDLGASSLDRLYRNDLDAGFTEVAEQARVSFAGTSNSCGSADLDLDGWPDLVVSCYKQYNKAFYNNGDGTFSFMAPAKNWFIQLDVEQDLASDPAFPGTEDFGFVPNWAEDFLPILGIWSMPLELQDFNGDGWIDICTGGYSWQLEDGIPLSAVDALFFPSERTRLYLNVGDQDGDGLGEGMFREVAQDLSLIHI